MDDDSGDLVESEAEQSEDEENHPLNEDDDDDEEEDGEGTSHGKENALHFFVTRWTSARLCGV